MMRKPSLEAEKEIARLVKVLVRRYQPEKIILFGSLARGKATEESDIDLLIIKKTKEPRIYRRSKALRGIPRKVPLDVLILTPEEVKFLEEKQSPFIREITTQGKTLYERRPLV
ncbi:nucleotidyltransferase domain-containing protein [Atrimonas thermophila]|uniref:nucleotidyltransferase domain-containing protein n=1 Tax=Atrimonas thermophila TaxID=3064161 RepID=UPI00399C66E1